MKRFMIIALGLIVATAIAPFFWPGFGSVKAQSAGPQFTDWSAIEPVSELNTTDIELPNSISHDGLSLYFMRTPFVNPPQGDIYVTHRPDLYSDWEEPVKLPNTINSAANEANAFVSIDGHWLYFASTRPGGDGGADIWVSYRRHVHDDTAWETPVNLTTVNSAGFDNAPMLFEDEETGISQLYFASAPTGGQPVADIFMSNLGPDGFEPPAPVFELNWTGVLDGKPYLRRDGLEIFFVSYRLGAGGMGEPGVIFVATRNSMFDLWSTPVAALSPGVSGPGNLWITTPVLSRDATTLFVGANKENSRVDDDIYVSYRTKVKGRR